MCSTHYIESTVKNFLERLHDPEQPVLLALSGGTDSLVLFHVLKNLKIEMALAHVDHGWRPESAQEAEKLKNLGYPLHLKALRPEAKGNLEDRCRQERLEFFKELCQKHGYQAVILAHHKEDQAETVLKRVLEGAFLPNLSGMREVTCIDGLTLWRPLLTIEKQQILEYIQVNQLKPFDDPTNRDQKFLRARMRTEILPELFGKQVRDPLCKIGEEAGELNTFLEKALQPELSKIETTPFGTILDLSECDQNDPFALKFLLRRLLPFPKDLLETAVRFLQTNAANKKLAFANHTIYIDRRRLFVGTPPTGSWEITVTPTAEPLMTTDWKGVLKGECRAVLPEGNYTFDHKNVDKWWGNHKVPAFLRHCVPVVLNQNRVVHEFLTGKIKEQHSMTKNEMGGRNMAISLKSRCLCGII